jgi:hypothetical protein
MQWQVIINQLRLVVMIVIGITVCKCIESNTVVKKLLNRLWKPKQKHSPQMTNQ